MPRFIPNQPVIFESDTQCGLNNDTAAYKMLMQGEDVLKIQIENTPCGGDPDGSICDIDINDPGSYIINTSFEDDAYWDGIGANATINETGGWAILDYQLSDDAVLTKGSLTPPTVASTLGILCKLTYTVRSVNIATTGELVFHFDGTTNSIYVDDNITTGVHEAYVYVSPNFGNFTFGFHDATHGDIITLSDVSVQTIAPCWQAAFDGDTDPLNHNPNSNAWTYSLIGTRGVFTANPNWDVYNSQSFPMATITAAFNDPLVTGDTLLLEYTITGMTAGQIYAKLGNNTGQVVTANGTYSEFITDDVGSDYIEFWTDADFDGTISVVTGKLFGDCHTFDIVDAVTGLDVYTGLIPQYQNDRINFFYQNTEDGAYPLTSGCYQIRFNDCCRGGESYLSETIINYTTGEHECTVMVDGSCDGKALGFDFDGGFTIAQRLKMLKFSASYDNSGTDADESNGKSHKTAAKSIKKYTALFNYCDEPTHDAINAQINCDNLTIDGVEYFAPNQDYEPDYGPRGIRNLAQGEIELRKKQSIIYNRNNI